MKSLSTDKENNVVALLEKGSNIRKMSNILGVLQSIINRVRKKHGMDVELSKEGRPSILTTLKKQFVAHLITVGGFQTTIEAIRELEREVGVDVCEEFVRNALRELELQSFAKISKLFF